MNYDRKKIKENAKAAMAAANPKPWLVTLVFLALMAVVPGTIAALLPNPATTVTADLTSLVEDIDRIRPEEFLTAVLAMAGVSVLFSVPVSIVTAMFRALMNYGYAGYSLEVYSRDAEAGVGSIFKSFPKFVPVIGSAFLVGVFSFLWGLLVYGVYGVMVFITVLLQALTGNVGAWVWAVLVLLFFVAALVHSLIVYRYCLTPYFAVARDQKAADSVMASVRAMRGNTFRRFVLSLSFLGWKLLQALIGFVVALAGFSVATLISSRSLLNLIDLYEGSWGGSYGAAAGHILLNLTGMILPFILVAVAAVLAQLPLKLWLMSYENISYAGFFQTFAGEPVQEQVPAAVAQTVAGYFDNGQPAAPAIPAAPVAPAPLPYSPFDREASMPQAPEVPAAAPGEETPVAPAETPVAAVEEIPAAPAEPQAPVAPAEDVPPAPEEPEN